MVNFGELLLGRQLAGLRYINYEELKTILEHGCGKKFDCLLENEILAVDECFARNPESRTYDYAVINYLAVRKIMKKRNKMLSSDVPCPSVLLQTTFYRNLKAGMLAECGSGKNMCPVCLSERVKTAVLPCTHIICYKCMNKCSDRQIQKCPLCRSIHDVDSRINSILQTKDAQKYHISSPDSLHQFGPDSSSDASSSRSGGIIKRVMTWNTCAFTFPLTIPEVQMLLRLIFFGVWSWDSQKDAPLQHCPDRIKRQAEYIKNSGADVVMLQEVLDEQTVDCLMQHLPEFEAYYCVQSQPLLNYVTFYGAIAILGAIQACALTYLMDVFGDDFFGPTFSIYLCWMLCCLRMAVTWQSSVLAAYLLGRISGQLTTLCKRTKDKCKKMKKKVSFHPLFQKCETWYLDTFYRYRKRGVLHVKYGDMSVINTHLPHRCDQTSIVEQVAKVCTMDEDGGVVIGGDFNPDPYGCNKQLFDPLKKAGFDHFDDKYMITWNLEEKYTRITPDCPFDIQLDFLLHKNMNINPASKSKRTFTLRTDTSDHYGLVTDL